MSALAMQPQDGTLTSIVPPSFGIFCASSTKKLFWVDERMLGRPSLTWLHRREKNQSLMIHSLTQERGTYPKVSSAIPTITHALYIIAPLTMLSSPHNNLVTVYDVSRDGETVLSHRHPSALVLPSYPRPSLSTPRRGLHFCSSTGHGTEASCGIFELSDTRELSWVPCTFTSAGEQPEFPIVSTPNPGTTDPPKDFDVRSRLGARDNIVMDLRKAYESTFFTINRLRRNNGPMSQKCLMQKVRLLPKTTCPMKGK
jgi:hypothetical protein